MTQALSVTQFITVINDIFDSLDAVTVEGEVDEFKIIQNKWVTFRLKDKVSSIGCFMTIWQYKTQIEDGMLVRAVGLPRVRNKGFFSFVVQSVQPAGEGALRRAFELLKKKLEKEGLFAPERKRTLPRFPQHVALITSRDAAAYTDFLKVLQARLGGLRISFIHTAVQGEDAPTQIVGALELANTELRALDVIVLIRGGGGLEDLQAFNDETVVRAVAGSRTPTIVGVGHERDTSLAELAADVRASTPSNAAEILVRSREELFSTIGHMESRLRTRVQEEVLRRQTSVSRTVHALRAQVIETTGRINRYIQGLAGLQTRLQHDIEQYSQGLQLHQQRIRRALQTATQQRQQQVAQLRRVLVSLSPQYTMQRGYSITRAADGTIVRSAQRVRAKDQLTTHVADGKIHSRVTRTLPGTNNAVS